MAKGKGQKHSTALTDVELARATKFAESLISNLEEFAQFPPSKVTPASPPARPVQALPKFEDVSKSFLKTCDILLSPLDQQKRILPQAIDEFKIIFARNEDQSVFMRGVATALEKVAADPQNQLPLLEACLALLETVSRMSIGMTSLFQDANDVPNRRVVSAIVKFLKNFEFKYEQKTGSETYVKRLEHCLNTLKGFLQNLLDQNQCLAIQLFSEYYRLVVTLEAEVAKLKVRHTWKHKLLKTLTGSAAACLDMLLKNQMLWENVSGSKGQCAANYFKGLYAALDDNEVKDKAECTLLLAKLGLLCRCIGNEDASGKSTRAKLQNAFFNDCGLRLWQLLVPTTSSQHASRPETPRTNTKSYAAALALMHLIDAVGADEYVTRVTGVLAVNMRQKIITSNMGKTLESCFKNTETTPRMQYTYAWLLMIFTRVSLSQKETKTFDQIKGPIEVSISLLRKRSTLCRSLSGNLIKSIVDANDGNQWQTIMELIPKGTVTFLFNSMLECLKDLCELTHESLENEKFTAVPPAFLECNWWNDSLKGLEEHFFKLLDGSNSPISDNEHGLCCCLLASLSLQVVRSSLDQNFSLASTASDALIQVCSNVNHPGPERQFTGGTFTELTVFVMLQIWLNINYKFCASKMDKVHSQKTGSMIEGSVQALMLLLQRPTLSVLLIFGLLKFLYFSLKALEDLEKLHIIEPASGFASHEFFDGLVNLRAAGADAYDFELIKVHCLYLLSRKMKAISRQRVCSIFDKLLFLMESWLKMTHKQSDREFTYEEHVGKLSLKVMLTIEDGQKPLQEIGGLFKIMHALHLHHTSSIKNETMGTEVSFSSSGEAMLDPSTGADLRQIIGPSTSLSLGQTLDYVEHLPQDESTSSSHKDDIEPPSMSSTQPDRGAKGGEKVRQQDTKAFDSEGDFERTNLNWFTREEGRQEQIHKPFIRPLLPQTCG